MNLIQKSKKFKKKINAKLLFSIFIVFLFSVGPLIQVEGKIAEQELNENPHNYNMAEKVKFNKPWKLPKRIGIFYDKDNIIVLKTAFGVFSGLRNLYANLDIIAVNSSTQFQQYLASPKYFIKMWFLEGDLYGLNIGHDFIPWQTVSELVKRDQESHNIFGSGSTQELAKFLDTEQYTTVHLDKSDIIDAQIAYVYYMFETSDILLHEDISDYRDAGRDIRDLTAIYFAENLNAITNAQLQPVAPLGQRDEAYYKTKFQKELDSYGNVYQILPDGSKRYLNDTNSPMADTGLLIYPSGTKELKIADNAYFKMNKSERGSFKASQLVRSVDISSSNFTISDLPLFSGLEGPVAGVVDTLLEVLIKAGGKKLGLNPDLAIEMANIVKEIGLFISDVAGGSGDTKTTIKALITRIANVAPIPEKLKPWLPIIVDAIFLYKAKPIDIVKFAKDVMVLIFNQSAGLFNSSVLNSISSVLEQVMLSAVDLSVRLIDDQTKAESEGKPFSAMSSIGSFFFEKMINFTTYEFIGSLLGKFNSTVLKETSELMKLVIPLIKSFISGDMGDIIAAVPGVVEYAVNKLSSESNVTSKVKIGFTDKQKSVFEGVGRFFDMAKQVYTRFSDCGGSLSMFTGGDLTEGLVKLLKAILPLVDFKVGQNFKLSTLTSMIEDIMKVFADASRKQETSRDKVKDSIKAVLTKYKIPTGASSDILAEMLTFLGQMTVSTIKNPVASDLRGIVDILLDQVIGTNKKAIIIANKPLSNEELATLNTFNVSKTTKKVILLIIDSVFGILSLTEKGESAQFLMLDNFYQLTDKSASCKDAPANSKPLSETGMTQKDLQGQLIKAVKGQLENLIDIFIGKYVPKNGKPYVKMLSETLITVLSLVLSGDGNSIMPTIQSMLMQGVGIFLSKTLDVNGTIISQVVVNLFSGLISGKAFGSSAGEFFSTLISVDEIKQLTDQVLVAKNASTSLRNLASLGIDFVFGLKDLFTDGLSWIFKQFQSYILSAISNFLKGLLDKLVAAAKKSPLLTLGGGIPFAGADVIGIKFDFKLTLSLNLDFDINGFVNWIYNMVFKGDSDLSRGISYFFKKMVSFINFSPIFGADLTVGNLNTGKPGMMTVLMSALPFDLTFTGRAFFKLLFISIKSGGIEPGSFLRVLEWGLSIVITISKTITVIDIVTGGAGGALNKVGKYIGLESIKVTIYFKIGMEIFYQAAKGAQESVSKLTFFLTIGAKVFIGFSLAIVKIGLELGVEVTLKFVQDLLFINRPLQITLDLRVWAKVVLSFLFIDWEGKLEFRPPGFPLDLSPKAGSSDLDAIGFGLDRDHDGLSNDLEDQNVDLNPDLADTDGDGLNDKFELRVSLTKPNNPDTDGDGVTDFAEYKLFKTDPFGTDTDYDGVNDYDEIYVYHTNPKAPDTDGDKLNDWWEIHHEYNMTGLDPSVKFVLIGGQAYTNKTDPLNFDTDGDGLPDGEEGVFGPYFGDAANYYNDKDNTKTDGSGFISQPNCYLDDSCMIDPMLIFNGGYTSPLDNDTDDDSFFQFYDGKQYYDGLGRPRYIGDMSDGAEVAGIKATVQKYDPVRDTPIWVTKVFFTSPVNPDSDGDTAVCRLSIGGPGYPWGVSSSPKCTRSFGLPDGVNPNNFLNGDGYELFVAGTDPLDADTDSDGLIDGLEGTLLPLRGFTTNPFKPDSDGDGLPDGLEFTIGTRPDAADSDNDQVLDGDEFYKYFTDPLLPDSDFDGVSDGWELFFSHSNPHSMDSDLDGLSDFAEIYYYSTDPMDDDSDNDGLNDQAEIFTHNTNPNNKDSDADGLRDGEEINTYFTDPNNRDTDGDSILWKDENGNPTFLWLDGQEVKAGTDPNSQDTDLDSITDAWEVYLATSDKIPIPNIALDPTNNDTDGDKLLDGQEMLVNETYSLIYPYTSYFVFFVYGSSPTSADTDSDGLDDNYEVNNLLNANSTDTDGDTLLDWDEIFIHLTDPRKSDSDGDGIPDNEEITAAPSNSGNTTLLDLHYKITGSSHVIGMSTPPKYKTSAIDSDSDGDGWPDGMEINATDGDPRYDPYDPDVNRNGVKDGFERDFDHDRISDGDEYYTYQPKGNDTGGFLAYNNPDSDFDGLLDGDEILIYGTSPTSADTDGDSFSDSLELFFGTDPLVFTPEHVFLQLVQQRNSPLQFVNLEDNSTIPDSNVVVEMVAIIPSEAHIESAWVQYREINDSNRYVKANESNWSKNYTMILSSGIFGLETPTWRTTQALPLEQNKEYEVRVQAVALNYTYPTGSEKLPSVVLENKVRFKIFNPDLFGLTPGFYQNVALGVVFVLLSSSGVYLYFKRRRLVL